MEAANPPPLPSRDVTASSDTQKNTGGTENPDSELSNKLSGLKIDISAVHKPQSLSSLLYQRQFETYNMPAMNEVSDVFAIRSLKPEVVDAYVQEIIDKDESVDEHQFWVEYLKKDHPTDYEKLETELVKGMPSEYRGVVYLKTLQVKFQLTKERYHNLLNKSSFAKLPYEQEINKVSDEKVRNALHVFNYYNKEVVNVHSRKLDVINSSNELNNNDPDVIFELVIKISKNFDTLTISELEVLYLIVKLNKLLINANLNELYYEISRSLEDLVAEKFVHITKQGINPLEIVEKQVSQFFDGTVPIRALDLTVFQGLVFLTRVFVQIYQQDDQILGLSGNELQTYLASPEFIKADVELSAVVKLEPSIVKYENEYYLLHINSLNNNNYELMNSKEINQDLQNQIQKLNNEIDNLKTTHEEIIQQSQEYEDDIKQLESQNQQLTSEYTELKSRFDRLTMKENLDNTIKANEVFNTRNQELEAQIKSLQNSIQDKSEKLTKYA